MPKPTKTDPSGSHWSRVALIILGVSMALYGLTCLPEGSVAGGNVVWFAYFGACLIFTLCGIQTIRKAKSSMNRK